MIIWPARLYKRPWIQSLSRSLELLVRPKNQKRSAIEIAVMTGGAISRRAPESEAEEYGHKKEEDKG
jgi:hypothetical protein